MREDERGPTDPVDDFENGALVAGNKGSTGEGLRPVDVVRKGDEVVDSSLIGKRVERPLVLRGNAEASFRDIEGFGVCLPAPQTDRHLMAGR